MKTALIFLTGLLMLGCLTGCSGETRSVEAYCTTMVKHRDQYLAAMGNTNELMGILGAASAIGDLKLMWDEMAKVAPSDIRADTEAVRDSWRKAEEAAIGGDFQALLGNALFNSGPVERVDAYIIANCNPYLSVNSDDNVALSGSVSSRESAQITQVRLES